MSDNEGIVRAAWDDASIAKDEYGRWYFFTCNALHRAMFAESPSELYALGAAFTDERAEQIRQKTREIEAQSGRVNRSDLGPWRGWVSSSSGAHVSQTEYIVRSVRAYATEIRILSTLQQQYADLVREMKPEWVESVTGGER